MNINTKTKITDCFTLSNGVEIPCVGYGTWQTPDAAAEGAVAAARDAVDVSQELFHTGLKDFTAVIDAQRSLLSLQEALVVSRGQITQNAIALYKSLGDSPAHESFVTEYKKLADCLAHNKLYGE